MTKNVNIIYDKDTNTAWEFIVIELSRQAKRDFLRRGTTRKQFTAQGNVGLLIGANGKIIDNCVSKMKIGDYFEGKRIKDLDFRKALIAPLGKDMHVVAFVYQLD